MTNEEREDYLEHHGILGMKWGVRRYQNKDGTLTAAGRKRYLNDDGSYNETAKKEIPTTAMNTTELKAAVDRLDLNRRYSDLTRSVKEQGRLSKLFSDVKKETLDGIQDTLKNKMVKALLTTVGVRKKMIEDMSPEELKDLIDDQSPTTPTLGFNDMAKLAKYKKNLQSIINGFSRNQRDDEDDD